MTMTPLQSELGYLSRCCNQTAIVPMGASEVTLFYVCTQCKKACDVYGGVICPECREPFTERECPYCYPFKA